MSKLRGASGRRIAGLAACTALGLGLAVCPPRPVFTLLGRLTPNLVWRVETDAPWVALSFDDGPHPRFTSLVLDELRRYGARATFFVIGDRAARRPELMARIRAEGHEIGNHYTIDAGLLGDGRAAFLRNLERTERVAGVRGPRKLFRPPGGLAWPWQLRLAREHGYTCVLGDAYPWDPVHPPGAYIEWLVVRKLRPGAIVILHDGIEGPSRSLAALPAILRAGRDRDLRFVPIGALLERSRTPI